MIPHASERLSAWRSARSHAGRLLVALDFDGTLAPIVDRPEGAVLPPAAREALTRLTQRPDTDLAIISGRSLEDLRARVALEGIYYGGNHGLEIEGPGIHEVYREAVEARPRIAKCVAALHREFDGVPGVSVEDKGLTLSFHYRRVTDPQEMERVRARAKEICGSVPGVRVFEGKRIVEVRPDVPWDKGQATRFLLHALQADTGAAIPAIFIGDDRTDEDAFRVVREHGGGVVVAEEPSPDTAALAYVRSPEEVAALLDALAAPD